MVFQVKNKEYKSSIRENKIDGLKIGGETALPFIHSEDKSQNKPAFALEVLYKLPVNYSSVLKDYWSEVINNKIEWVKKAESSKADIIAIRFNLTDEDNLDIEIQKAKELLNKILLEINKPIMVIGSFQKNIDEQLLPELAKSVTKPCIFGPVDSESYKTIIPSLKENGHSVIARTPIDINLAKELNILISEMGFPKEKIFIDPNMGALGYGLDYGYSIIERIKQAGLDNDLMLNMPILAFVGEESWKTKESKSNDFTPDWGSLEDRALIWESMTASTVVTAGANIVVMWHPENVNKIKKFIDEA